MRTHNTPKQILIIDDNITNLKVAMAELTARELEIIIARNGETGLEREVGQGSRFFFTLPAKK